MDIDTDDVDKCVEWLHSGQYSAAGNIFGEPQKTTRVGDEYQAQIPSLMTKSEQTDYYQNHFVCGMSMPVTEAHNQHKNNQIHANENGKSGFVGYGIDNDLFLIACSSGEESWSSIEHGSFILGLYIFGKNLRVVNKFMGNKGMQNVVSYYYGKFYRSNEHKKWSTYRKKRISKSVPGKKIFRGWRLHELLSRVHSNVTDECKASLTQVIRSFESGIFSFEKYVFTLRDTMGVDLLIEAVAIGKGNQDLTITRKTRLRSKKVESKCTSTKTEEIDNILKDQTGQNKVRLNEIFWTGVWPRLLARGWHSEQLRSYASQNSKNLVFLAPGVTKFSRRSLVKGNQYFDSVTELLDKVESEPHLLEDAPDKDPLVEPHATEGSDDEQNLMKFTVVDTSLVGLVHVIDLTSLTVSELADMQASTSVSGDTGHDTTDDSPACERVDDRDLDVQPARKLNLVFKQKTKCHRVTNIKIENTSGEDEAMEDAACSKKKLSRIVIDLNSPRVGPVSDDYNKTSSPKQVVLSETTNGIRQSRRNRALTPKALEALANGFMNPKKKRRVPEDGTRSRVRAKTAVVSSCGEHYLADGVFDGSSHLVTESLKMT